MGSSRRNRLGQKNLNTLKALLHFDNNQRRVLLRKADKKLVILICECGLNILRGNVLLNKNYKNKLKKYALFLRKLSDSTQSLKNKKKFIIKYQTCLPLILVPVIKLWSMQEK